MKISSTIVAAAIALLVAPVACRGPGSGAPAPARPAGSGEGRTLRVLFDAPGEASDDFLRICRDFEATNPGVKVVPVSWKGGDRLDQIRKNAAAGESPDITMIDCQEFSTYHDAGLLLDLQPFMDKDPTWKPEAFFEGTLEPCRGSDGHLYGIAANFTPYIIYFNKNLLREAGLEPPKPDWRWEDLLEIARKCTKRRAPDEAPYQYGLMINEWPQALAPWIWQNGGDWLDHPTDPKKSTVGEPAAVEAFAFLRQMMVKEKVAVGQSFSARLDRSPFAAGRVALYGPVGYWMAYEFRNIKDFEWDAVPLPRGKVEATAIAQSHFVGLKAARHPELAYKFLRELTGERMSRAFSRVGNSISNLEAVARDPEFNRKGFPPDEEVFFRAARTGRFMAKGARWKDFEDLVRQDIRGCLNDPDPKFEADQACARMAREIDGVLDSERRMRAVREEVTQ